MFSVQQETAPRATFRRLLSPDLDSAEELFQHQWRLGDAAPGPAELADYLRGGAVWGSFYKERLTAAVCYAMAEAPF